MDPNIYGDFQICSSVLLSCAKTAVEKFSFNELKIEKIIFFTQSRAKIFYIRAFKVGGCLASCLTFRPFLTLAP